MRTCALLGTALAATALVAAGCGDDGYELTLRVDDASGLRKDQDVKIDGVRAGTVTGVQLTKGDRAEIRMRLDPGAAPVGRAATGRIRSVSVLGEKYVDLVPDRKGGPLPSGSRLRADRHPTPVELDDVLNTLDASTRTRLRMLLVEGGIALTGRGEDVASLLRVLPKGMDEVGALIADASRDVAALERVVVAGDRVIGDLAAERSKLGELVDTAAGAFSSTAERRAAVGQTIAESPATMTQLRTSLDRLEATAVSLRPAARRLRAASPALEASLRTLPAFARDATPALEAATDAAPDLSRLARAATPTVRRLKPVAAKGADTLEHAYPLVRDLDRGLADDALYFLQTWARVTQRSDGLGHLFGAQIIVGDDTVRMITDRVASNLADQKRKSAPKKDGPVPAKPGRPAARPAVPPNLPVTEDTVEKLCEVVDRTLDKTPAAVRERLRKLTGRENPCPPAGDQPQRPPGDAAKPIGEAVGDLLDGIGRQANAPKTPAGENNGDQTVSALVDYLFGS